jgi:hypothetical protein
MKKQKPSWHFLRAAARIQTGKRNLSAKLVLLFLADAANDQGQSWHGLRSISAFCNGMSISAVHEALCFLRDYLHILSWRQGSGGPNRKDTNTYTLNLQAMQDLIVAQGVFDTKGKLIYKGEPAAEAQSLPLTGSESVPLSGSSVVSAKASVVSAEASVPSAEGGSRFRSAEANPYGTTSTKPQYEPRSAGPVFAQSQVESIRPQVGQQPASGPPIPRTPQGPVSSTQFQFGDPLPGLKWAGYRGAYIDNVTGREVAYEELQRRISLMKEAS